VPAHLFSACQLCHVRDRQANKDAAAASLFALAPPRAKYVPNTNKSFSLAGRRGVDALRATASAVPDTRAAEIAAAAAEIAVEGVAADMLGEMQEAKMRTMAGKMSSVGLGRRAVAPRYQYYVPHPCISQALRACTQLKGRTERSFKWRESACGDRARRKARASLRHALLCVFSGICGRDQTYTRGSRYPG